MFVQNTSKTAERIKIIIVLLAKILRSITSHIKPYLQNLTRNRLNFVFMKISPQNECLERLCNTFDRRIKIGEDH